MISAIIGYFILNRVPGLPGHTPAFSSVGAISVFDPIVFATNTTA
jgi:hypothetical protein